MSTIRRAAITIVAVLLTFSPGGARAGVKASSWISTSSGPVYVQFSVFGPCRNPIFGNFGTYFGTLLLRPADHRKPQIVPLNDPQTVLALLADKRMEFMWQPLTQWAGPTLELLRDRTIAQLRDWFTNNDPAPGFLDENSPLGFHVRALLQLTNYLMMAGRYPEAEQLLRENLAKMPLKGGLSLQDLEWEIVALEIAKARRAQGDVPGAISEVALIEATLRDSPYAVNATIERAALLVKSGNYAEGLAALDDAAAKLNLLRDPKSKTSVVPSANRGLAWIRACALKGVGRSSEAAQALKPLFETAETDTAKFSDKHPDRLQTEAEVCMSDVSALKKQIADGLRSEVILTDALLFQPAYRPKQDKAIWGAVRSDPELQQLAAERTRVLPPEMTEALNWNEGER